MNIVILEETEVGKRIAPLDPRALHIKRILKKKVGDTIKSGIANKALGVSTILAQDEEGLVLDFKTVSEASKLAPLTIMLAFPRPIQVRRLLKDLTTLGLERIILFPAALGEKSYLDSRIMRQADFRSALLEGAAQAGSPMLPSVDLFSSLGEAINYLDLQKVSARLFLHPDVHASTLPDNPPVPLCLALGAERGWTQAEVERLASADFVPARLGSSRPRNDRSNGDSPLFASEASGQPRILRTETAALVGAALVLKSMGYL